MRAAGLTLLASVTTFSVAHAQTTAPADSGAPAGAKTASTTGQFQRHNALIVAPTAAPEDFTAQLFSGYNSAFDAYTSWKNDLNNKYNLSYTLQSSYFLQSATPYGGKPVSLFVYSPSITWTPINSTTWGTGQFNVAFQQAQYWSGKVNNAAQQASIGTITTPNDWSANTYSWSQLSYTHTLPGAFNWLSLTVGQYSFGQFDGDLYAGNAQTNFITYALAQNATQTYPNAGVGGYASIAVPNTAITLNGGSGRNRRSRATDF